MTRLALVIALAAAAPTDYRFNVSCECGQRGLAFSARCAFQPRGPAVDVGFGFDRVDRLAELHGDETLGAAAYC